MRNSTKWTVALIILILFSGTLGCLILTEGHNWGGDFAGYVMQAKSVAEGNPQKYIEENKFTSEKSSRRWSRPYPWGMPVLLSFLYKIFGMNILAFKSLNVIFYTLFLISIAFFLRERHSNLYHFLLVSLFALNPTILSFFNNVLSDIPFLFFSTTSVFLVGRVIIERRRLISNAADHFLLGIMLAISYFIRTNGVLLVLTVLGVHVIIILKMFLADRKISPTVNRFVSLYRQSNLKTFSINILPYITFIGITLILNSVFSQVEVAVNQQIPALISHISLDIIKSHAYYYFDLPAEFFSGVPYPYALYFATFPFLLAGIIKSADRDYHMVLFILFNILLYVLFRGQQGLRYFFPLLPFYIHFVFVGFQWCFNVPGRLWARAIQGFTTCLLLLITLYFVRHSTHEAFSNMLNHRKFAGGPYTEASQDMFSFISENVPKNAIIVFYKPRVMRMLGNRQSIMVDKVTDLKRGSHLCIQLQNNNYDQIPHSAIEKLESDGMLKLIFTNSNFRLYQIL